MKTIKELEFDCADAFIKGRNHSNGVTVTARDITGVDFDKKEIAECVSIRTMIEAHSLAVLIDYLIDEYFDDLINSLNESSIKTTNNINSL